MSASDLSQERKTVLSVERLRWFSRFPLTGSVSVRRCEWNRGVSSHPRGQESSGHTDSWWNDLGAAVHEAAAGADLFSEKVNETHSKK